MPAPALASPSPLTVLVLAWDAAAPAVRTLIETAPGLVPASLGPLLVLVPPVEELPPTPTPELAETPATPAASADVLLPAATPAPAAESTGQVVEASDPVALPAALAAWEAAPALAAPQPRPAVRVTHLTYGTSKSLSQRTSLAPTQFPAAPYLGATPPVADPAATYSAATDAPLASLAIEASYPLAAPTADAAQPAESVPAAPLSASAEAYQPEAYMTEEALAPDLEADLLPDLTAAQELPPLATAQSVDATTAFSVADQATTIQPDVSDSLSLDAVALVEPAIVDIPSSEDFTSSEADEFPALAVPAAAISPAETPVADTVSRAEPVAVASPPLQPAAASYPAPDLNAQVIRYARFAVPAALAEGPFGAIYAPAWPTWLAALELRQRTGCPLVLHLPALAAGRQPADTAAGWTAEIQRQALRQADVVLTETYALARRLRRELGLASTVVRVVPVADGGAIARALRRARRREAAH